MHTTIINPAGNWVFWTEALKQALATGSNNSMVGEQLVFEQDRFKVWSIDLPPGGTMPFHKHQLNYLWTAITEGEARSYYNDGSVKEFVYSKGDTMYFDDLSEEDFFIHNLINTGSTHLIFTTIEFLK